MTEAQNTKQKNNFAVPGAIVLAGLLVATAIVISNGGTLSGDTNNIPDTTDTIKTVQTDSFRLPTEDDHVLGNPKAKTTIVEFSDFECPYCGLLHPTLTSIVESRNDVNWVYRHFPLSGHPNAFPAAVASECVAKLGGNDAFWEFANGLFENQRSLGKDLYEEIATTLGINIDDFNSCQESRDIVTAVQEDLIEARATGGTGTPHSVIITPKGELIPFSGALGQETIESILDQVSEL